MSVARATGVVVDTMVISWLLDDRPKDLADEYRELVGTAPMLLAFQTLMELRYGALRRMGRTSPSALGTPCRPADRGTAR